MPVWGQVLIAVATFGGFLITVVAVYTKFTLWLGTKLDGFERTLSLHAAQLNEHAIQFNEHAAAMRISEQRFMDNVKAIEQRHSELAGTLQRLIGRSEIESGFRWRGEERRKATP